MPPVKNIIKNCLYCKVEFKTSQYHLNKGGGKYCSLPCANKGLNRDKTKTGVFVRCGLCEKEFYKSLSKLKNSRSGIFFCCKEHKAQAQKIGGIKEIQPSHYGTATHYRKLAFNELSHNCSKCGYDKISQILEVHHKDCNRNNNNIKNLEFLCPTCHDENHFLNKTGKWRSQI